MFWSRPATLLKRDTGTGPTGKVMPVIRAVKKPCKNASTHLMHQTNRLIHQTNRLIHSTTKSLKEIGYIYGWDKKYIFSHNGKVMSVINLAKGTGTNAFAGCENLLNFT